MRCANCGNQLADGAKFCIKCGTSQVNVMPVSAPAPVQNGDKKKKSPLIAIIAVFLVLAFLAGGTASYFFFFTQEKRLERKLKSMTDKEVIEFYYDDFNADEIKEAFAVTGKGVKDDFSDGEIWFVSDDTGKMIKESFDGSCNGILEEEGKKYISVEVENEDDTSLSYIYGVEDKDEYFEPEISGQFSHVHQSGDKIVTDDGEQIRILTKNEAVTNDSEKTETEKKTEETEAEKKTETDKKKSDKKKKETVAENKSSEPTKADFERLAKENVYWVCSTAYGVGNYDSYNYADCSVDCAISRIVLAHVGGIYWTYFGELKPSEKITSYESSRYSTQGAPDPLNKFDTDYYQYLKIPADKVEWVLKNILNIEPDRSASNDEYYYYEGYYYRVWGDAGDGSPDLRYVSSEKLGDGKYRVILQPYFPMDNVDTDYRMELVVGLKEIDGKRLWSYYKVGKENG